MLIASSSASRLVSTGGIESVDELFAASETVTPDEIMRMPADTLLLLRQGERPLWASKIRYYDQREFAGLFDPA